MALLHLLFMLFKIAVLAPLYAALILLILIPFRRNFTGKLINKASLWKFLTFICAIGLFIFSFTYWGNHGLGDTSRIPIGQSQVIYNSDGVLTYFYPVDGNSASLKRINSFTVFNEKLCAEQEDGTYLIFDLSSSVLQEFETPTAYEEFALKNRLPQLHNFKKFTTHYSEYWNGWRLYLLP